MISGVKKYYQKLQQPAKASLWFLICGLGQKGIAMLTMPVFVRLMTEAEYGRYSVYNSWYSMIEIIVTLDLAGSVFTRGLIKYEHDQDGFASSLQGLTTTFILLWSAVYFFFHEAIAETLGMSEFLCIAMLLEIWTHSAYHFWANKERTNFRYKQLVVLTVLYVVLRPALGICFVLSADVQRQVEARMCAVVLVNLVLFSWLYVSLMRRGRRYYNKEYWLYGLRLTIPLLPHCLSHIALSQIDRVMINELCGASEAAYYSVAYTLASVLQILNSAIVVSLNPWLYRKIKSREHGKIGELSYGILLLVILANLSVVIMAPELLRIIAPANYQVALWAIPPVTISVFFMALYNLFVAFEYYYEKTYYVTIATVGAAVINISLNAILIPRFGFVAAGYTTLLSYALCAAAHYYFMRKISRQYMDGTVVYDNKMLLGLSGALLVVSAVAMLLYERTLLRYMLLLVVIAVVVIKRKELLDAVRSVRKKES